MQIKNKYTKKLIKTIAKNNEGIYDLQDANLEDADLQGANLEDANLPWGRNTKKSDMMNKLINFESKVWKGIKNFQTENQLCTYDLSTTVNVLLNTLFQIWEKEGK